jgi:hypothetical protein
MKEKIQREVKGSIFLPLSANTGRMLPAAVREEDFDRGKAGIHPASVSKHGLLKEKKD